MVEVWDRGDVPGVACSRNSPKAPDVVANVRDDDLQDALWEIYRSLLYHAAVYDLLLVRSGLGLEQNCVCEGPDPYAQMERSGLTLEPKSCNVLTGPGGSRALAHSRHLG